MNRHTLKAPFLMALVTFLVATVPLHAFRMIQVSGTGRVTQGDPVTCWASGGFAHWHSSNNTNIQWRLNTANQGSGKAGAIQAAAAAWTNVPNADHRMVYAGTTTAGFATDGQNTVLFANSSQCSNATGCLALTALVMRTGQVIVESDIVFNNSVLWRTNGTDFDTQAIMAHELGHALGIHHSDVPASRPTMRIDYTSPGIDLRTLEADDRAALQCSQNRYGIRPVRVTVSGPASRGPNQWGTWTCSVSGGVPPYTRGWFKTSQSGITNLGTSSSQSTRDTTSFNIICDAIDSSGRFGTDHIFVDVDGDPGFPPLPF